MGQSGSPKIDKIHVEDEYEHEVTMDDTKASMKTKEKEAAKILRPTELITYKETTSFQHLLTKLKKDHKHKIF